MRRLFFSIIVSILALSHGTLLHGQTKAQLNNWFAPMCGELTSYLEGRSTMPGELGIDKIIVSGGVLKIHFTDYLAHRPLRKSDIEEIHTIVRATMPAKYGQYRNNFKVISCNTPLEELASRPMSGLARDNGTANLDFAPEAYPLVRRHPERDLPSEGLAGRHIALWQSHGYYYDQNEFCWKWQRPRLFETVEDLYTQSFVLPFLVPMLENAGAVTILPRERDVQNVEILVDGDMPGSGYSEISGSKPWKDSGRKGFSNPKESYYEGENPFTMGKSRIAESVVSGNESYAFWNPAIENNGEYGVYVSYSSFDNSAREAEYKVVHNGGTSRFIVNQTMGGGTWIYLGTFGFSKENRNQGVTLSNKTGRAGETVSADAVKFGGGMGNIIRKPYPLDEKGKSRRFDYHPDACTSGYPRWCEGARCWLQWAGMVDTIYSVSQFTNDYKDDYSSRGRWVNALCGGTSRNPEGSGYNIPIDLALAFHTDAGITRSDSIVGTLAIYTKTSDKKTDYPSGGRRIIARDLSDMVQSEVVKDIRATFEPEWSRRSIWDKSYAECRVPHVPTMILELMSHQNFADMRYGLDPSFRFIVSRAVYKGILKFLAYVNGTEYTVQPLPVKSFAVELDGQTAVLNWKEVLDSGETSAKPERYILYTRISEPDKVNADRNGIPSAGIDGFDNGRYLEGTTARVELEPGKIYSFKVAAVNEGGESFPSEILSAGIPSGGKAQQPVLVVNNFDRIGAPPSFASTDTLFAGFDNTTDGGVPYLRDISYIGNQFEFRRSAGWLSLESASFGASHSSYENKVIAGNTFDYPLIHGAAILNAGYGFVSCSRAAVMDGTVALTRYRICDLICGKQIRTITGRDLCGRDSLRLPNIRHEVFPAPLRDAIKDFCAAGGCILASGAYVASDSRDRIYQFDIDSVMLEEQIKPEQKFTNEIFRIKWVCDKGSETGCAKQVQNPYNIALGTCSFPTRPNSRTYPVESPDGLASLSGGYPVMKYDDSGITAAVAHKSDKGFRSVIMGFPLEVLDSQQQVNRVMASILEFFR